MFNFSATNTVKKFNKTFWTKAKTIRLFLLLATFQACQLSPKSNPETFENCPAGIPEAIFADSFQQVVSHSFMLKKRLGIEEVEFNNGLNLQILQSGCEKTKQEFRFQRALPPEEYPDSSSFWYGFAGEQMEYLSKISMQHRPLSQWGELLFRLKGQADLNIPIPVAEHFQITLDRIMSDENVIIILIMEEI